MMSWVGIGLLVGLALVILGLAAVGVWALLNSAPHYRPRRAYDIRPFEAQIDDIGQRAQAAILAEVLRQFRERSHRNARGAG